MNRRRTVLKSTLALGLLGTRTAVAQSRGTVRLLLGFQAGAGMDALARAVAEELTSVLGMNVIVENRPGASGTIAAASIRHAQPDGLNLLFTPSSILTLYPHASSSVDYDTFRDFSPLGSVASFSYALAVNSKTPASTIAEYLALARKDRKWASVGTAGAGTPQHFLTMLLSRASQVDLLHVPYKGSGPAIQDTLAGHVPAVLSTTASLLTAHHAGQLRILGISEAVRSADLPDVATFKQQGYPDLVYEEWCGIFAPAKTPQPMVDKLSSAILKVLDSEKLRERFLRQGFQVAPNSGAALSAALRAESTRWAGLARSVGFSAQN